MVAIITIADLPTALQSAELIDAMLAGANAKASRLAPCLTSTEIPPSVDQLAEARLILIGAVKRWQDAGSGAFQSQQAGPFGVAVDTRQRSGYNFWPSEIEQLQAICVTSETSTSAFSITPSGSGSAHLAWCSLAFGALYCSCGVDIAGEPIFELD